MEFTKQLDDVVSGSLRSAVTIQALLSIWMIVHWIMVNTGLGSQATKTKSIFVFEQLSNFNVVPN